MIAAWRLCGPVLFPASPALDKAGRRLHCQHTAVYRGVCVMCGNESQRPSWRQQSAPCPKMGFSCTPQLSLLGQVTVCVLSGAVCTCPMEFVFLWTAAAAAVQTHVVPHVTGLFCLGLVVTSNLQDSATVCLPLPHSLFTAAHQPRSKGILCFLGGPDLQELLGGLRAAGCRCRTEIMPIDLKVVS